MKISRLPIFVLYCFFSGLICSPITGCMARDKEILWDLSPQAQDTYATLLLDQSLRTGSTSGVIEASEIFLNASPVSPQPIIEAASWLLFDKDTEAARLLLQKAVKLMPDDLAIHMLLAEVYVDEKQPDKALGVLRLYNARHPDSDQGKQELGFLMYKLKFYQEADKVFRALPVKLRTPYVRLCHAQALIELNRPKEAVRQLSIALADQPDSLEIRSAFAEALNIIGEKDRARSQYAMLLKQNPENMTLRLKLIQLELETAHPEKALQLTRECNEDHPFCLSAVSLFLDSGYIEEAQAFLLEQQLKEDAPDDYQLFLAAALFQQTGDASRALAILENLPETSACNDRAIYMMAQILLISQNLKQAENLLVTGLSRYPDNPDFAAMLAQIYITQNNFTAARQLLEEATAAHPNNTELLFFQGSILDHEGDYTGALAVMEKIIAIEPDHYRALNYIGFKLADTPSALSPDARKKELERALELLQRAVKLAPTQAYILDSLAWAQYKAGQLDKAWETIRATVAMKNGTEEAEIWEHYGDIANSLGKKSEAKHGWEKALALNPQNADALREKLKNLVEKR